MTSLARQLAEHPRWRWEEGMYLVGGCIVNRPILIGRDGYHELQCYDTQVQDEAWITEGDQRATPDIDHPATKGWLLAMLREATGYDGAISARRWLQTPPSEREEWELVVETEGGDLEFMAPTEGEALARALLAAWNAEEVPRG